MKSKRNFTARWIIAGMLIAILSGAYIPVNGATIDAIVGPFTFTVTTKACFFAGGFSGTTVTIDGVDVQPGDVVGAFVDADPTDDSVNDLCIGAIAVTNAGVYPLLNAYGDDPGGDKDGADDGETVHFKIWDASEDRILYGDTSDNTVWEENQSKNVGLAATSGISADGTGTAKDSFVGEDIYGKAVLGLIAQTTYPIFVMADNASWSNGDPLTHMVGPAQSFSTDAFGHMDTTLLWADPTPGNYDIIVDVDADGFYNPEIDYLDDNGQIGFTTRWPTITVTVGPNGTVEHPPGGPLTSPAVVSIEPGTSPVFTITPDACHYVDIVSVDGQPLVGLAAIPPAGGTYTFTAVTDDHTLGAYFDEYYYTIATSATPPEGGTITPASPITVYCGNPQTITITPATCYEIGTVEICGPEWLIEELTGTSAACAYVTATIDGNGVGTLELPAVNSFAENAQAVTLEVTFSLLGPYFVSATPTAADPPAGGIITASVDSVPFDLTGENMLPCGTLLDVTVTPDVCYEIIGVWITVGWQGTPEEVTSPTLSIDANGVGTFTHEVLDNVYITATFGTKTVRLTGTISAGRGTIFHGTAQELASTVSTDPPVSGQLDLGCPATDALTASAVDCYYISRLEVNGAEIPAAAGEEQYSYLFEGVTSDQTFEVWFAQYEYTITSLAPGTGNGGGIEPPAGVGGVGGDVTVLCGENQSFDITPDPCWEIAQVTVDGAPVDASEYPETSTGSGIYRYTFTNVLDDHAISATFTQISYEIAYSVTSGNGTIAPDDSAPPNPISVLCGEDKVFYIEPAPCWEIAEVAVDGTPVDASEYPETPAGSGVYIYTFMDVQADHAISVTFTQISYEIAYSVTSGNGAIVPDGRTSPSPVSVLCGEVQAFDITPDPCWEISVVTVDGAPVDASEYPETPTGSGIYRYTFTDVQANHEISVTFTQIIYNIAYFVTSGSGAIVPDGSTSPSPVPVLCGEDQAFDITPAPCWEIAEVIADGAPADASEYPETSSGSGVYRYTFTNVPEDLEISVTFTQISYEIAYSVTSGNGAIAPDGSASPSPVSVLCGEDQAFDITPDPCWEIAEVTVDGTPADASEYPETSTGSAVYRYTFTNVQADHAISVTFTQITYEIAYSVTSGSGAIAPDGSTSPSPVSVLCGEDQAFNITPDPCWEIAEVIVDGTPVEASSGIYTFTDVQANHEISVTFTQITYEIAYSVTSGNGTIVPDGSTSPSPVSVLCGEDQAFNMTPDSCWEIAEVTVDGTPAEASGGVYTFTDVQADHEISVTFTLIPYTLTLRVKDATGGSINGPTSGLIRDEGPEIVDCGDKPTITMTPDDNMRVKRLVVCGVTVIEDPDPPVTEYVFVEPVISDCDVEVTFEPDVHIIVSEAPGYTNGGGIIPVFDDGTGGETEVSHGSSQAFDITPDPCWEIAEVTVDGTPVNASEYPETSPGSGVYRYIFTDVQVDHEIFVTFTQITYEITHWVAGGDGTIEPVGSVPGSSSVDNGNVFSMTVLCGTENPFDMTPDPCWEMGEVAVDGTPVDASEYPETPTGSGVYRYTFANVQSDRTISVTFTRIVHTVTTVAPGEGNGGAIVPPMEVGGIGGAVAVLCGDDQMFTMTPDAKYYLDDVVLDEVSVMSQVQVDSEMGIGVYTLENVRADHTLEAIFELSPLRLLSASYEVCETLLTLVFDQPIDPASALFNRIDMEIEDSGNLDFGLGDIERCLVAIPGIPVDGGYPVMINILCEVPAVATLGIAAFITHKDKDIDLILAPGAFTAQNGATNGVEDVPLKITVDGRVLTRRGDLSGDGVISAYDAGLLLQFRVFGPRVLPVYDTVMELGSWLETFGHADAEIDIIQYLADTDGRVGVTANDAAEILKLCAGLIPAFPACDSCAPVADMTHRNGRLVANSLDDQRLEVSIDLDDVRDVNSADIVLTYNPQALTVADVSGTDAVSDWLAVHGTTAPGQLRIALAGAEQPVKNGSLVTVSFDVASSDAIKQLDLTELRLNGLKATVQNLPKAFALMQNYPNPFNPETWIPYKLSESADVTVTIYNTVGQVVKQLELGNRMPGEYVSKSRAVYWNGENEWGERVSSGIYFYQLQAGRDASVKKMIIAK